MNDKAFIAPGSKSVQLSQGTVTLVIGYRHTGEDTIITDGGAPAGDQYYMIHDGVRGPGDPAVVDEQFGLGLARSLGSAIDGPCEKYPDNPIILDLPGNVGVGHADIVLIGPATYLYTTTEAGTRGRFVLLETP